MNPREFVLPDDAVHDGSTALGSVVSPGRRGAGAEPLPGSPGLRLADCAGLLACRSEGGVVGVRELDLRRAVEDRVDPATPIASLADPGSVASDLGAARARLVDEPRRLAVLVETSGTVVRVERPTEPVRDAVVMAGGFGTRLRPLTDELPKPLLDVGGRPLLHRILEQLRAASVERVAISVHYLGERVEESVGDGSDFGLEVRYLREDSPLDTGAGLVLLGETDRPFFVVNGDILTTLDFRSFGRHHSASGALATMATWLYDNPLAYGVVETEGDRIVGIAEKPVYRYPINSGIYAFSPQVLERVVPKQPLAMVDFLLSLIEGGHGLGRFPIVEYWNDVGSHADYERAQSEVDWL